LAAAIARTATLRPATSELLTYIRHSALAEAQILLADGPAFELSPALSMLADSERTHFASRVGAGITDLYMNALGYAWRDNAACLATSLEPHGDFLYHGGNAAGHGVVLAEARGSFAAGVTDNAMAAAAKRKYSRQVQPYIDAASIHGPVVHGYALAFGSRLGTQGAFLRVSQTRRPKPKAKPKQASTLTSPAAPTIRVPTAMALATHRSNFTLMDALPIAAWIDWLGGSRERPEERGPIAFVQFGYEGRSFLTPRDSFAPYPWPFPEPDDVIESLLWWRRWATRWPRPLFAVEETAAVAFLRALTDMIRIGRSTPEAMLELPEGDIVGFGDGTDGGASTGRLERERYNYALFRDGLALLAEPQQYRPTAFADLGSNDRTPLILQSRLVRPFVRRCAKLPQRTDPPASSLLPPGGTTATVGYQRSLRRTIRASHVPHHDDRRPTRAFVSDCGPYVK
jgi:hypothetical protein